MFRPSLKARSLALPAILTIALGACIDERIVFQDRELFETPAAAALGFLGYSDQEDKLTVCGNCHVGVQAQWEETAHADAWAGLRDSGHAQDFCEGCHTVNELGNPTEGAAGYSAAPDERYHDVQCESCHGPGLTHVENPDASQPVAGISVGLDLTTGCGECHSGTHHPFAEEWSRSAHAKVGFQASRDGCRNCHSGDGALAAWGIDADYLEKDAAEAGDHVAITCAVCHDPHGSENDAQLRFPINTPEVGVNLCSKCHDRRTEPDPGSSHGLVPHAPEAALLEGDVGWFPPGAIIDRGAIISTHGSEANPSLCATCHVNTFTVNDQITGEFLYSATGHVFNAIPCLDAQGIPTTEDCGMNTAARSFAGCTGARCHGTEQTAFSALTASTMRLRFLSRVLIAQLTEVDPNLDGAGGEIDAHNPIFTVAEGAFFNNALAAFGGDDRADPLLTFAGAAAHNPFLMEALLIGSIDAVEAEYGVAPSPSLVRTPILPGN